jgi:hypothetical protein
MKKAIKIMKKYLKLAISTLFIQQLLRLSSI